MLKFVAILFLFINFSAMASEYTIEQLRDRNLAEIRRLSKMTYEYEAGKEGSPHPPTKVKVFVDGDKQRTERAMPHGPTVSIIRREYFATRYLPRTASIFARGADDKFCEQGEGLVSARIIQDDPLSMRRRFEAFHNGLWAWSIKSLPDGKVEARAKAKETELGFVIDPERDFQVVSITSGPADAVTRLQTARLTNASDIWLPERIEIKAKTGTHFIEFKNLRVLEALDQSLFDYQSLVGEEGDRIVAYDREGKEEDLKILQGKFIPTAAANAILRAENQGIEVKNREELLKPRDPVNLKEQSARTPWAIVTTAIVAVIAIGIAWWMLRRRSDVNRQGDVV